MPKEIPQHKDIIGRVLSVGDYVAYPYSNELLIGRVEKLNPRMINVTLDDPRYRWLKLAKKYSKDTIKIEGEDMMFYLLKQ